MNELAENSYAPTRENRERRAQTEQGARERLSGVVNRVVEHLKANQDQWVTVSFENLVREGHARYSDRKFFIYLLQSGDNTISQPANRSHLKDGTIAPTIPMQYKYVKKEEKEGLGYDAICFRKIQGSIKDKIVHLLSRSKAQSKPWDQLCIYEQYMVLGANKGWKFLDASRVATLTGATIDVVHAVLADLATARIAAVKEFSVLDRRMHKISGNPYKKKWFIRLCWPDQYETVMKDQTPTDAEVEMIVKKERGGKTHFSKETVEWITGMMEENQKEPPPIFKPGENDAKSQENRLKPQQPFMSRLKKLIDDEIEVRMHDKDVVLSAAQKELNELREKLRVAKEEAKRASQENTELREKIASIKEDMKQETNRRLSRLNEEFASNIHDAMLVADGGISEVADELVRGVKDNPDLVNDNRAILKFKGRFSEVFRSFSNDISSFSVADTGKD